MILLLLWTMGMYIMWIYTHSTLALRKCLPEEIPGENRAVLELAVAMQDELDIKDTNPTLLREKQLKERIKKEIRGGSISSANLSSTLESHSLRKSLITWFKIEKWWFLAILSTSAICLTGRLFIFNDVYWWFLSIWFGQFWAFCIGTTVGSRLLIILIWSFAGGIAVGTESGVSYGIYHSYYQYIRR
jgi:hypothetical protein